MSIGVSNITPNEQENNKKATRKQQGSNKETLSDPELSKLIKAWPGLPDAIRAGIIAMIHSTLNERRED